MATFKRKIILINRKFQFRFSFYVCSWLILLSFVYPLIIASLFDSFIHYLAADPLGPGLALLEKTRNDLFSLLIAMQLIMLGLAFVISIYMSHKIAGPIYKLGRFFREARDGNIEQELTFRKKDYFMELVPAYNEMMQSIQKKIRTKNEGIDTAIQKLEVVLQQTAPELRNPLKDAVSQLKLARKS